jgi:hypothetical protein
MADVEAAADWATLLTASTGEAPTQPSQNERGSGALAVALGVKGTCAERRRAQLRR